MNTADPDLMQTDATNILDCRNLTVHYGDVTALDNVEIGLKRNRIHAVVGQNGAGKTTFARVLAGLVKPAAGGITMNGHEVPAGSVTESRKAGIELVHQSFALPPSFTIAEAMQFGAGGGAVYSKSRLERRWQAHLDNLEIELKAGQRIRTLPVEMQQAVEIARALVSDASLLILDEPTAVLSPEGASKLFDRVRRLRDNGVTVILILHKIREVMAIAETVTVLRGGRCVAESVETKDVEGEGLAELIVGTAASTIKGEDRAALTGAAVPAHEGPVQPIGKGESVLRMAAVSTRQDGEGPALDAIDLSLHAGEIVGVAGVEGNGQRTLVRAIAGLAELDCGTIEIDNREVEHLDLIKRRTAGLRIIPFERNVEGLSLNSSLWENWSALQLLGKPLFGLISPAMLRDRCARALDKWNVVHANVHQRSGALSGGNAQKLILSREIDNDARVVIAAQPTRGLDIGATAFVWDALRDARSRGCGVLFVSSDLDEIFDISDRVAVMYSGRIVAIFDPPYDLAAVGAAMTGAMR